MKRFLIWFLLILIGILVGLSLIGIPYFTSKKLPYLLTEKNQSPYHLTYGKADVSLIGNTLLLEDITAIPKANLHKKGPKEGFYIHIKQLRLQGLDRMKLLKGIEIQGDKLEIIEPEVIWYNPPESQSAYAQQAEEHLRKPLQQLFQLKSLQIINGDFYIKTADTDKEPKLRVNGIQFKAKDLNVNEGTLKEAIPAAMDNYELTAAKIAFQPKGVYVVSAENLRVTNREITAKNCTYSTPLSKTEYTAQLATERDWYQIKVPQLRLADWSVNTDSTGFSTRIKSLELSEVDAQIYRDKRVADDFRIKPLYNALLRKIPFGLQLDTLRILNSKVTYSEQISANGAGDLRFTQFNLTGTGIGSRQADLPNQWVELAIKTQFMQVATTQVNWRFDIANLEDAFTMKGTIRELPLAQLRPFIKPYLNVEAEGKIKEVAFNLYGNDRGAKGDFIVQYNDLKVTLFQNEAKKKKNKVLSFVANLALKSEKKGDEATQVAISVEREKHKSFFNLFWKSLADGLKKSMLVNPLGIVHAKEKSSK